MNDHQGFGRPSAEGVVSDTASQYLGNVFNVAYGLKCEEFYYPEVNMFKVLNNLLGQQADFAIAEPQPQSLEMAYRFLGPSGAARLGRLIKVVFIDAGVVGGDTHTLQVQHALAVAGTALCAAYTARLWTASLIDHNDLIEVVPAVHMFESANDYSGSESRTSVREKINKVPIFWVRNIDTTVNYRNYAVNTAEGEAQKRSKASKGGKNSNVGSLFQEMLETRPQMELPTIITSLQPLEDLAKMDWIVGTGLETIYSHVAEDSFNNPTSKAVLQAGILPIRLKQIVR